MNNMPFTKIDITKYLDWLIEFISKPLAGWSFTIALAIFAYIKIEAKYIEGLAKGASNSAYEIKSLKESGKNDELEIFTLKGRVAYYKKQLDTCNNSSQNSNLEELVNKKLEEADRLKKILERKLTSSEKINNELKTVLK